jgi:lipoprotein-anchoring transpeptidase ErfK/SrfK
VPRVWLAVAAAVVAAAVPAAANARPPLKPVPPVKPVRPVKPVLTLKAPKATAFGHRIDFVGRLSPDRPGVRVSLLRGGRLVAAAAVRRDGSFRIPVRIASPGPFRVRTVGAASPSVTVTIHPQLEATVAGGRVTASVTPAAAGALRVRVTRAGTTAFDSVFFGTARVRLSPTAYGKSQIDVSVVARNGYAPKAKRLQATLAPPSLAYGSTSPAVVELTRQLAMLHYAVPSSADTFSGDLVESVYAFQKVHGLPRTGQVDQTVWDQLSHPLVPRPRYTEPGDHIEVDKTKQVLYIVRNGSVALISPVSTAGIPGYYTPVGRFAIYRKVVGYDPSPLGVLLDPMYFVGGYAIHGNPSVPPYPASHGCIRVPNFVIYRLFPSEPYGETVYVY